MKVKKIENDMVLFDTEPNINNECKTWSNYNFIVAELCSFSRSIDHTKTGQMDQKNLMGDVKNVWEENSNKNEIIKTLPENLNTTTNALYKSSDKNIAKLMNVNTPLETNLKYQRIQEQILVFIETNLQRKKSQRNEINLIA